MAQILRQCIAVNYSPNKLYKNGQNETKMILFDTKMILFDTKMILFDIKMILLDTKMILFDPFSSGTQF